MLKEYDVDFDMKASHVIRVKANNAREAKTKAFAKFKERDKQSSYNIYVDEL